MVFGIIGENCSGKSTLAEKIKTEFGAEIITGKDRHQAEIKHICFFFVDGRYHRRGIGTRMFRRLLEDYPGETITLNSSPYGRPFYKAIGFVPTDEEKTVNGIRFTPMKYDCK